MKIDTPAGEIKAGSKIAYRTTGGGIRVVEVEDVEENVKNDYPGFYGTAVPGGIDAGMECWGYADQVTRVIKF